MPLPEGDLFTRQAMPKPAQQTSQQVRAGKAAAPPGEVGAPSDKTKKKGSPWLTIAALLVIGGVVRALVMGWGDLGIDDSTVESVAKPSLDNDVGAETAPSPEPKPAVPSVGHKLTADFEFHSKRPGYGDAFYVLGEVHNTSEIRISKPEIVIVMLDDSGKEVGTGSGYALAESLEPGEKSYVSAIVTKPPAHTQLRFEVVPRAASYVPKLASGLSVQATPTKKTHGMYDFSGKVSNAGNDTAKFINVRALAFDANDKLLGVYSSYAKAESLGPGESARFSVSGVGLDPEPARFEYQVSARLVE